ncbi:hypothetical protein F2Q69_00019055 [Brassica cretica]|uniref:Uncharacterized protein n=1 Tax=Brassica cretica TaxID=69181 RepID=A0A8S9QBW7_BRACR|nr:hypothetical protein F2Q69_00019055 [Brassica cretica]
MNIVNPRLSLCSSRRDESVATKNASIGVRTKPYAPPQVSPTTRVSFTRRRRKSPPLLRRLRRRFGVHLSGWSSYIPLLFIAKVLRLRSAEMSALGRGICGAALFEIAGYRDICARPWDLRVTDESPVSVTGGAYRRRRRCNGGGNFRRRRVNDTRAVGETCGGAYGFVQTSIEAFLVATDSPRREEHDGADDGGDELDDVLACGGSGDELR